MAELLPGVDVIAFGVHVGAGNFAQALRSISKTRWTDVSGDVTIAFELQRDLEDFQVADIQARSLWRPLLEQVSNAVVMPVASFMYGGLLDIAMNFIEVNASGQKRHSPSALGRSEPFSAWFRHESRPKETKRESKREAFGLGSEPEKPLFEAPAFIPPPRAGTR